jgi:hypothetical protein
MFSSSYMYRARGSPYLHQDVTTLNPGAHLTDRSEWGCGFGDLRHRGASDEQHVSLRGDHGLHLQYYDRAVQHRGDDEWALGADTDGRVWADCEGF